MNTLRKLVSTAIFLCVLALVHFGHRWIGPITRHPSVSPVSSSSPLDYFQSKAIEQGSRYDKADCLALPHSVRTSVQGVDHCVRYYFAPGSTKPREAVVFLSGDWGVARGNRILLSEDWRPQDPDKLQAFADGMRPHTGATSIYFGRMGVSGSSGYHALRRTPLEVEFTSKALDLIKAKHGIETFHLVGQSGGSRLIQGLMAGRDDIGCAVLGAGQLTLRQDVKARNLKATAPYREFDPEEHLDAIATRHRDRIFVITDPDDIYSPAANQSRFVELMQSRGAQVSQVLVRASDNYHHEVIRFSMRAAYDCVNGVSADKIAVRRS